MRMTGGKGPGRKSTRPFWRITALLAIIPIILLSPFAGIMTAILHENNEPKMWEVIAWGLLPGASVAIFFAVSGRFLSNGARWASAALFALGLSTLAFAPHLAILAWIVWPILGLGLLIAFFDTFVEFAKNEKSKLDAQIRWIASALTLPVAIISVLLTISWAWGGGGLWFIGLDRFEEVFASSLLFGTLTATTGALMFRRVAPAKQAPN